MRNVLIQFRAEPQLRQRLDRAAKDPVSAKHLTEILDAFLERDCDRELFDLAPRPPAVDPK